MARITQMAWGDTSDPANLDADFKAVTAVFVYGTEMLCPRGARQVAFDLVVDKKNATTDLELIINSSVNKGYWAPVTFLDTPTSVGDEIHTEIKRLIYDEKGIVDGHSNHVRLNLSTSEHLRLGLKGDAGGATVKIFATFFDDMRKE